MKMKLLTAIALLSFSGVLFAWFWPESRPAGALVEIQDQTAADAGAFARKMLEFARKDDRKNFAANCVDLNSPDLSRQYTVMRQTRLAAEPSWKVQKADPEGSLFLVLIETVNGGAYRCVVARNATGNDWKFSGLYDE